MQVLAHHDPAIPFCRRKDRMNVLPHFSQTGWCHEPKTADTTPVSENAQITTTAPKWMLRIRIIVFDVDDIPALNEPDGVSNISVQASSRSIKQ
jgi:hypothetical protein